MANFDSQISTQIKLISEYFIKPRYEVEASKQPYYLGVVDLGCLTLNPIQKGLLFSTKPKNMPSDFLNTLKNSLSACLVHYYPLAGRFSTKELPDENSKWIYLDCTKGPGTRLIHATADYPVSNILSSVDVHPIVSSFFDLGEKSINYDGHTRPLLSIQVTELIDGVFIGFSMNHSLVDGNCQWNFINSLSEIFLQLSQSQNHQMDDNIVPIISRRPVFKPYFPDGWGPVLKLPNSNMYESISTDHNSNNNKIMLRERIFHFSSKSISKLKAKANEECGVHNTISSFQALSALMWRSITRARNLRPELETCCALAMNARPRFNQPLSNDYFGNFIMRDQSKCKVGELLSNNLGWASMLVHKVVVNQDDKTVRGFYEWLVKFLCRGPMDVGDNNPFCSPSLVMIGGSARFDVYETDFGLGKAETVLAGYCNKDDGKVTAAPGREGCGSVDLEVCLKSAFMNALESDEDFMSFVNFM